MKAVVLKGPGVVAVEEREIPKLIDPRDALVRVRYTAVCGSDLHAYRAVEAVESFDYIAGHEFLGEVAAVGDAVTGLQIGDRVVSPFTISCGKCFYCTRGYSARCEQSLLFGSPRLDGGQAEYVRVPLAETTLLNLKDTPRLKDERILLFLGDVLPTGMYAVVNALEGIPRDQHVDLAIVGCGPVGICAIIAARHLLKDFASSQLIAFDSVPSRLAQAENLGARALSIDTDVVTAVRAATGGRGLDAVCEVVGHESALQLAFDCLRPFGRLSSVGVHNAPLPFSGEDCFSKNVTMIFGRCPVRSILPAALELIAVCEKQFDGFIDHFVPIEQAVEAYRLFDERRVHKVVFDLS